MEQDQGGCGDVAEAPGTAAVAAQGLVTGLKQGVRAFTQATRGAVEGVVGLLIDGQLPSLGFLNGIVKVSGSPS
jgi:hypothetical protein